MEVEKEEVEAFLAHYGVLGMKWGVRKDRRSKRSTIFTKNIKNGRRKDRLIGSKSQKPKSGYRTLTEAHYLKKGFSLKEAEKKAARDIKIAKIVAISAGVAVASLGAYVAGRHIAKEYIGAELKKGTLLQHISTKDKLDLNDSHLYTTFKKLDKFNYQGTFATELKSFKKLDSHALSLKTITDIKAPSNKQGAQFLSEMLGTKVSKDRYRSFIDTFHGSSNTEEVSKFKDLLLSKGFNAVIDTTDQVSYAKAYKPLIVFKSKDQLLQQGARALKAPEVARKLRTIRLAQLFTTPEFVASATAGAAASGAAGLYSSRSADKAIDAYYKEHPKTKMSRVDVALALDLV